MGRGGRSFETAVSAGCTWELMDRVEAQVTARPDFVR